MNKELLKLPLYTLLAGFILRFVDERVIYFIVKGTKELTPEMMESLFYIDIILSVVLFLFIGIKLRKIYDKKMCFQATSLLVIYSIAVLAWEQILQYLGSYSILALYLYIPIEIFTVISSVLLKFEFFHTINFLFAIPSLFAPYFFLLFIKKDIKREIGKF